MRTSCGRPPTSAEAERTQKVRIGQDRLRDAQMNYWNGARPLTGISNPELLRASHIVRWADCESDEERLNVYNGLLLSSLWDAAFDSGLVTFDDHGRVIASPSIDPQATKALRLEQAPTLTLTDEHRDHLAWHRTKCWRCD